MDRKIKSIAVKVLRVEWIFYSDISSLRGRDLWRFHDESTRFMSTKGGV